MAVLSLPLSELATTARFHAFSALWTSLLCSLLCELSIASFCDWAPKPHSPLNTEPIAEANLTSLNSNAHGRLFRVSPSGANSTDDDLHLLHLFGNSPYQWGKAHGHLLAPQIGALVPQVLSHFNAIIDKGLIDLTPDTEKYIQLHGGLSGALDALINATAPYTPPGVIQELHGIADGCACNISYRDVAHYHFFPELIQASCSFVGATGSATPSHRLTQVRALDWDTSGPLQQYPLIIVYHPTSHQDSFSVVGWAGFIGALTGVNSHRISLTEIGVGYPDASFGPMKREGIPFLFLMRNLLQDANGLEDAVKIVQDANRTMNLLVGIGDGHAQEARGIKYTSESATVYNADDLEPYNATTDTWHPRINDTLYWAMDWNCPTFDTVMADQLQRSHGDITAAKLIRRILPIVNTGNLHVAIYDYSADSNIMYVSNAKKPSASGASDSYLRTYIKYDMDKLFALSANDRVMMMAK